MKIAVGKLKNLIRESLQSEENYSIMPEEIEDKYPDAYNSWKKYEKAAGRDVSDSIFYEVDGVLYVEPPIPSAGFFWDVRTNTWKDEADQFM